MIKTARYISGTTEYKKCPEPNKPEFAFIGRSNVGKSSLINMLTNQKKLAKTSGRPGKTQIINHFLIDEQWYLVDLPGYGWAKISKAKRAEWEKMIRAYLLNRENLFCVFVLVDSRIPPQNIDLDFIRWLGEQGIPLSIIFTKTDKQSNSKTTSNVNAFLQEMQKDWVEFPEHFRSSSETGEGKEQIISYIVNAIQSA
ncbi:ribosome biogenesis GTP-binding protein YihA/YsxC [Cytophagaceae bacterium ABcell3]|nr:ribosome biogenesis GTP-binding protein YihA/YsxC [Cytophagaceae bacterium ABcell3]